MKTKTIGDIGEEYAVNYLKKHRYKILSRNYRKRFGEIDIIAEKKGTVAFVEVKTRRSDAFAEAKEFVGAAKQRRIRLAASMWLASNETQLQPRFDVIEIYGTEQMRYRDLQIRQIENAFE